MDCPFPKSAAYISIHAPAKGATVYHLHHQFYELLFQSTLPRRERPNRLHPFLSLLAISIHAPAKGATFILNPILFRQEWISIHAPAKGATVVEGRWIKILFAFQSTLPRRERRILHVSHRLIPPISIHAPAKGATTSREAVEETLLFQSTLPRRERRRLKKIPCFEPLFQSTLPRRERHSCYDCNYLMFQFQSTLPRRERRRKVLPSVRLLEISIHAPAKGATQSYVRVNNSQIFQSTLPRRERLAID